MRGAAIAERLQKYDFIIIGLGESQEKINSGYMITEKKTDNNK